MYSAAPRPAAAPSASKKRKEVPQEKDSKEKKVKERKRAEVKVARCSCCGALSSDKQWSETCSSGTTTLALGDACGDCWDIFSNGFSWISWEEFISRHRDHAGFRSLVKDAASARRGKAIVCAGSVMKTTGQRLEIRSTASCLNEAELCSALSSSRLPKHMKSIPKISIPKPPSATTDIAAADSGKSEVEELYLFDAGLPRTVSVVTTFGIDTSQVVLGAPVWQGQCEATMWSQLLQQAEQTNQKVLGVSGRVKFVPLSAFLQSKTEVTLRKKHKFEDPPADGDEESGTDKESSDASSSDGTTSESQNETVGKNASSVGTKHSVAVTTHDKNKHKSCASLGSMLSGVSDAIPAELGAKHQQLTDKLAKLPLARIIEHEPHGGWGRSFVGLERYRKRLMKHEENASMVYEVSLHLQLAHIARSLQAERVGELANEQLTEAIARLKKAAVELPACLQSSLLTRRVIASRTSLLQKYDQDMCKTFLDVVLPFLQPAAFDYLDPKAKDLCAKSKIDKVSFFVHQAIEKLLISGVSQGEGSIELVKFMANALHDSVKDVDPWTLSTREASLRGDLMTIGLALKGLLGDYQTQLDLRKHTDVLREECGKTGNAIVVQVSNAISQNSFYSNLMDEIALLLPTLATLQPELVTHTALFEKTKPDDIAGFVAALSSATEVVWAHVTAPQNALSDEFNEMLSKATKLFFESFHAKVAEDLKAGDMEKLVCQDQVKMIGKCLADIGIVFPMASWVVALNEEHSSVLRELDDASHSVGLTRAMASLATFVNDSGEPPGEERLREFESSFAKASPALHFKDAKMQNCIKGFVEEMVEFSPAACDSEWKGFASVVTSVSEFLIEVPPMVRFLLALYTESHALSKSVNFYVESLNASGAWQDCVRDLVKALASAGEFLESMGGGWNDVVDDEQKAKGGGETPSVVEAFEEDAKAKDGAEDKKKDDVTADTEKEDGKEENVDTEEVKKTKQAARNTVLKLIKVGKVKIYVTIEWLRSQYVEKTNALEKSLGNVAGGYGAEDWVSAECSQELEWEPLFELYKATLKKCRVSVLDGELKMTELHLASCKEFEEFFATSAIPLDGLKAQVTRGLRTRLSGVLMKLVSDLEKDASKLELVRAKIRREMMDGTAGAKAFGLMFAGKEQLPTALFERVDGIVSVFAKKA